jgi:putative transposase
VESVKLSWVGAPLPPSPRWGGRGDHVPLRLRPRDEAGRADPVRRPALPLLGVPTDGHQPQRRALRGIDKLRAWHPKAQAVTIRLARDPLYRGYRFPAEIISHAVGLSYRFALSHRDVEGLLAERGVQVSYEALRRWCQKFGPAFAAGLRRRRVRARDCWHLDEVQLKIKGQRHWLWRAVDRDGLVLDILVQARRNQEAAERFRRRVRAGEDRAPRVVITDKLASYPPALKRVLPQTEHRRHTGLNNRAENSHRAVRKRERALQRFKSPEHAQRFLEPFGAVGNHFCPRRHLLPAKQYREIRTERLQRWREVVGLAPAA